MSFTQEEKLKAEKKSLQNLREEIDALLFTWEDLESELRKSTGIKELAGWIADLGLDFDLEDRASCLAENYQRVKTGIDNILNVLYKLKKDIKLL